MEEANPRVGVALKKILSFFSLHVQFSLQLISCLELTENKIIVQSFGTGQLRISEACRSPVFPCTWFVCSAEQRDSWANTTRLIVDHTINHSGFLICFSKLAMFP